MTKFGDWARGPTLASVHSGSQAQQRIRDIATLAAQCEEALEAEWAKHVATVANEVDELNDCLICPALRACKEFMEKYG